MGLQSPVMTDNMTVRCHKPVINKHLTGVLNLALQNKSINCSSHSAVTIILLERSVSSPQRSWDCCAVVRTHFTQLKEYCGVHPPRWQSLVVSISGAVYGERQSRDAMTATWYQPAPFIDWLNRPEKICSGKQLIFVCVYPSRRIAWQGLIFASALLRQWLQLLWLKMTDRILIGRWNVCPQFSKTM